MAARKWSQPPKVTGKCTEQHFELVSIPPKSQRSDENLSWDRCVTSSIEPKKNRIEIPKTDNRKVNSICSVIEGNKFDPPDPTSSNRLRLNSTSSNLTPLNPASSKPFHSDCISAGSLLMRVSTESTRRSLEQTGRSIAPPKEQSCIVCNQRKLLPPTPSVISAIVESEFLAHKERKEKAKKKNAHKYTEYDYCINHLAPYNCILDGLSEESLKSKIQKYADGSNSSMNTNYFRKKLSKLLKSPVSFTSIDRESFCTNDIILDESDYLRRASIATESFSILPSSDDGGDTDFEASTSMTSLDKHSDVKTKTSNNNSSVVEKHRKRCEELLKEAEELKAQSKRAEEETHINAEGLSNYKQINHQRPKNVLKKSSLRSYHEKCLKTKKIEDSLVNKDKRKAKNVNCDNKTRNIIKYSGRNNLEELSQRLANWKENTLQKDEEYMKWRNYSKSHEERPTKEEIKADYKVDRKESLNRKESEEQYNLTNHMKGVIDRVIPSWLRLFGTKKTSATDNKGIETRNEFEGRTNKSLRPTKLSKAKDKIYKSNKTS